MLFGSGPVPLSLRAFELWPKEKACLKTPWWSRRGRLDAVAIVTDWSSCGDLLPRHSEDALGEADVRMDGVNEVSGECKGPRTSDPSVTRRPASIFKPSHLSLCD
jgi:hypothetical protein